MGPTPQLVDELFWDKVKRARDMDPAEKLLAGPRLFDQVCRIMCDGIRDAFPDADEERVQAILRERLVIARRLEEKR